MINSIQRNQEKQIYPATNVQKFSFSRIGQSSLERSNSANGCIQRITQCLDYIGDLWIRFLKWIGIRKENKVEEIPKEEPELEPVLQIQVPIINAPIAPAPSNREIIFRIAEKLYQLKDGSIISATTLKRKKLELYGLLTDAMKQKIKEPTTPELWEILSNSIERAYLLELVPQLKDVKQSVSNPQTPYLQLKKMYEQVPEFERDVLQEGFSMNQKMAVYQKGFDDTTRPIALARLERHLQVKEAQLNNIKKYIII